MDGAFSSKGIGIGLVPSLVFRGQLSYELVIAVAAVDLLLDMFPTFKLVRDFNPFLPTQDDIYCHGLEKAHHNAVLWALERAAGIICKPWIVHGPAETYRAAAADCGLQTTLERAILVWDVQVRNALVSLTMHAR